MKIVSASDDGAGIFVLADKGESIRYPDPNEGKYANIHSGGGKIGNGLGDVWREPVIIIVKEGCAFISSENVVVRGL